MLHGPWPVSKVGDTFISAALRKVVPKGIMADAMCDWETGGQLERDAFAPADGKPFKEGRMQAVDRVRRREQEARIPAVMRSLRAVAEGREAPRSEPQTQRHLFGGEPPGPPGAGNTGERHGATDRPAKHIAIFPRLPDRKKKKK